SGFVTILGRPNTGKSTLLNALVGSKIAIVSEKPQTTRAAIQGVLTVAGAPESSGQPQQAQIIFLDTPGVQQPRSRLDEEMMREVRASLSERDLLLLLVDASRPPAAGDRAALDLAKEAAVPCFLVLNKIDLIRKDALLPRMD